MRRNVYPPLIAARIDGDGCSGPLNCAKRSFHASHARRSATFCDRPAASGDAAANTQTTQEAGRILARGLTPGGTIPLADRTYLAQQIAARTGLSQADAEKRINDVITQAQQAADDARRAAAQLALLMAAALICGALASALAAAEGGRMRDG